MNIKKHKYFTIIFLIICLSGSLHAQSEFQGGMMPKLNLNKNLNENYSLNLKTESRNIFFHKSDYSYDYDLTDIALTASKKTSFSDKIVFGYLIRLEDKKAEHRIIEQFSSVKRYSRFSLGHRIASDQTFSSHSENELRLRYRIAAELPLNGDRVDNEESYLKISNEYLNSFTRSSLFDPEIRVSALYGFVFSGQELEIGFDNRISSFTSGNLYNELWLRVNLYLTL